MVKNSTLQVREMGQSIWLDNIQRSDLLDRTLSKMMEEDGLAGMTSNPTIFMNAISKGEEYRQQIKELAQAGKDAVAIYNRLTEDDIRSACKIMMQVFERTDGNDGFVSIELNPQIAYHTEKSIQEAKRLFEEIDFPNLMVKVPGTPEGIPVVQRLIAEGFNINITLLFSPKQYEEVALAYIKGLEQRLNEGKDISRVNSVASFFISRIDTKADKKIGHLIEKSSDINSKEELMKLRGRTAVEVAKVTYGIFKELFQGSSFKHLQERGAKIQRPLWASTSTKDPSYSDVKYVDSLIGPHTVNTLPPQTIDSFRDHGVVRSTLEEGMTASPGMLEKIMNAGVDLDSIYGELLNEGVKAFEKSYVELIDLIDKQRTSLVEGR